MTFQENVMISSIVFLAFDINRVLFLCCREQLLRALSGMINDNFLPALKECRRPQLCLRSTLEQLLTELNPVDYQDEIDICTEILDKVFSEPDTNQER